MVSSRVMATPRSRSHRPHVFICPVSRARPAAWENCGNGGTGWQGRLARPLARPKSAAQRDGLRRIALVLVDPRIGTGLLPRVTPVKEVLGHDVAHGTKDRGADARVLALELPEELLHPLALEVLLRSAEIAGNDGELHLRRERRDVALGCVAEGADDDVAAIVAAQPGWHRAQLAGEEH